MVKYTLVCYCYQNSQQINKFINKKRRIQLTTNRLWCGEEVETLETEETSDSVSAGTEEAGRWVVYDGCGGSY